MKTVVCDICGKSKEELNRTLNGDARIFNYKRTSTCFFSKPEEIEFDICSRCLLKIKELSLGGEYEKN